MLDKIDAPTIPEGYGVTIAFHCLLELVSSVRILVLGEIEDKSAGGQYKPAARILLAKTATADKEEDKSVASTGLC